MARSKPATKVRWKAAPDEHDYPAAASYLSLVAADELITRIVDELRAAPTVHYKAKDILRAARLDLLPRTNVHVAADLGAVARRERLSPILLVRGSLSDDVPLQIADGYHRVCASYYVDENTAIPCRLSTAERSPRKSTRAPRPR